MRFFTPFLVVVCFAVAHVQLGAASLLDDDPFFGRLLLAANDSSSATVKSTSVPDSSQVKTRVTASATLNYDYNTIKADEANFKALFAKSVVYNLASTWTEFAAVAKNSDGSYNTGWVTVDKVSSGSVVVGYTVYVPSAATGSQVTSLQSQLSTASSLQTLLSGALTNTYGTVTVSGTSASNGAAASTSSAVSTLVLLGIGIAGALA